MNEEKIYQFNEYILGYDNGRNDRSCLTISKIQNGNMYVMSSLYDGSAEVISLMLDSLQKEIERQDQEIKKLKESSINGILMNDYNTLARDYKKATKKLEKLQQRIDKATEYINSFDYYIPEDNVPELLNILKPGDNNEII